jgi:hypothetical protein
MCRDGRVLTADAVQPIIKRLVTLNDMSPTFAKAPRADVHPDVHTAADALSAETLRSKKSKPALATTLKTQYKRVVTACLKPGDPEPKARDQKGNETEWVKEVARAIVTVCREQVPKSWAVLTRESRSGAKLEQFQRVVDLCRGGFLFDETCAAAGPSTLSRDVWTFCKAAPELDLQTFWNIVVKGPLGTTLDAGLKEVYAPAFAEMIFAKMPPGTDVTKESLEGLLLESGEHGLSILNHACGVTVQTKNLHKECRGKIGNWSRLTHFHRTDSL